MKRSTLSFACKLPVQICRKSWQNLSSIYTYIVTLVNMFQIFNWIILCYQSQESWKSSHTISKSSHTISISAILLYIKFNIFPPPNTICFFPLLPFLWSPSLSQSPKSHWDWRFSSASLSTELYLLQDFLVLCNNATEKMRQNIKLNIIK